MSEGFHVSVEKPGRFLKPGERLVARCSWARNPERKWVELRLVWKTKGKGDEDFSLLEKVRFEKAAEGDVREKEFQIPEGPYSFSGKLISVVWALELLAGGTKEEAEIELTVGPDRREILVAP